MERHQVTKNKVTIPVSEAYSKNLTAVVKSKPQLLYAAPGLIMVLGLKTNSSNCTPILYNNFFIISFKAEK